jgi:hypothetical protein
MSLFRKQRNDRCVSDDNLRWLHNSDLFLLGVLALMEKAGCDDKALMEEIKARITRGMPKK